MKSYILSAFVLFAACNPFAPDDSPRLRAWVETLPDSMMQLPPERWTGVVFRAKQHPADTTFWTLDWLDAGMRIDGGVALPGEEALKLVYVPLDNFSCFLMYVAWGPRVRADTAVWVQFRN